MSAAQVAHPTLSIPTRNLFLSSASSFRGPCGYSRGQSRGRAGWGTTDFFAGSEAQGRRRQVTGVNVAAAVESNGGWLSLVWSSDDARPWSGPGVHPDYSPEAGASGRAPAAAANSRRRVIVPC
ncbi:hypothetical protein VPH35_109199 [Triticum aestivum]